MVREMEAGGRIEVKREGEKVEAEVVDAARIGRAKLN
jgi:hypothetical protein